MSELRKKYIKSNQEARKRLLKKFGATSLERLLELETIKSPVIKLTLNELVKKLLNTPNKQLTLSFQKQYTEKEVNKMLEDVYLDDFSVVKVVKDIYKGKERIVKGFHKNSIDNFGRLYMTDEEQVKKSAQQSDSRMILVTLFNLNWIKIDETKYILK